MKNQTVWVVTGKSESADSYGPEVYSKKPDDKELKRLCHEWDGSEDESGPGNYGSYVYVSVEECKVK